MSGGACGRNFGLTQWGFYCHSKPWSLWCVSDVPWVVFCCQTLQIYFSCSWEPIYTHVELRGGKAPCRNYQTQSWEWTPGRTNNSKYNKWVQMSKAGIVPSPVRGVGIPQENSGICCSPHPFQALWASKPTWAPWPRGLVFVTRDEGLGFAGFCAKMSQILEWGAQSHLQAAPALFPLPWQCLGRAQRAENLLLMTDLSPGNEAFNSSLIISN